MQHDPTLQIMLVLVFLVGIGLAYIMGRMDGAIREMRRKQNEPAPAFELDEELAKRTAKQHKAFADMMAYDMTQALKGGRPDRTTD